MNKGLRSVPGSVLLGALLLLAMGQLFSLLQQRKPAAKETTEQDFSRVISGTVIRLEIPVESGDCTIPLRRDGAYVTVGEPILGESAPAAEYVSLALPQRRALLHEVLSDCGAGDITRENAGYAAALLRAESEAGDPEKTDENANETRAPAAGYFCSKTDGLETVLTPEDPWPVIPLPPAEKLPLGGKIVLSEIWYFAAVIPDCPDVGNRIQGQVLTEEPFSADFTVERREITSMGFRALLSCGKQCGRILGQRNLSVIFSS